MQCEIFTLFGDGNVKMYTDRSFEIRQSHILKELRGKSLVFCRVFQHCNMMHTCLYQSPYPQIKSRILKMIEKCNVDIKEIGYNGGHPM